MDLSLETSALACTVCEGDRSWQMAVTDSRDSTGHQQLLEHESDIKETARKMPLNTGLENSAKKRRLGSLLSSLHSKGIIHLIVLSATARLTMADCCKYQNGNQSSSEHLCGCLRTPGEERTRYTSLSQKICKKKENHATQRSSTGSRRVCTCSDADD